MPTVFFAGQVSYKVYNAYVASGLGNTPDAEGYILCMADDWDLHNGTEGDLLIIPGGTKVTVVEADQRLTTTANIGFIKFISKGSVAKLGSRLIGDWDKLENALRNAGNKIDEAATKAAGQAGFFWSKE